MAKTVIVSAGIIENDGKYLIAQRKETCQFAPSLWEFPGGKIELNETPQECLVREIKEELDIEIECSELFDVESYTYPELHVVMIVYMARYLSGEVRKVDVQDFKWVTKDEMSLYEFAPADISLVRKFQSL